MTRRLNDRNMSLRLNLSGPGECGPVSSIDVFFAEVGLLNGLLARQGRGASPRRSIGEMPRVARARTDLRSAAAREDDHATTDVNETTTNGVGDLVRAYREANSLLGEPGV